MSADLSSMVAEPSVVDRVDAWMAGSGSTTALSQLMYADFKTWLPDNLLTKMDRMTMATSVEGRVPLLDHKVVEFAAMLPARLKLTGLRTKRLLRSAVADLLAPELLQRPKTAFRVPLAEWFQGPLSTLLHDTFSSSRMRQRGFFEPSVLDLVTRPNGELPRPPAQAIWNLLWLELWFQQFVDANPAADR
jgi:asparagine synthase (glutamine-hydrolysing)